MDTTRSARAISVSGSASDGASQHAAPSARGNALAPPATATEKAGNVGSAPPLRRQRSMIRLRTAVVTGNDEDIAAVLDCAFRGVDSPLSHFGPRDLVLMATFRMQQCLHAKRELVDIFQLLRLVCWALLNEVDACTVDSASLMLQLLAGDLDLPSRFAVPKVVEYMANKTPEHLPRALLKPDRSNSWHVTLLAALCLRLHCTIPESTHLMLGVRLSEDMHQLPHAIILRCADITSRPLNATSFIIARCALQALGNIFLYAGDSALRIHRDDTHEDVPLERAAADVLGRSLLCLLPHLAGTERCDVLEVIVSIAGALAVLATSEHGQLALSEPFWSQPDGFITSGRKHAMCPLDAIMRMLTELQSMGRSPATERTLCRLLSVVHAVVGHPRCRELLIECAHMSTMMRALDGHVPASTEMAQCLTLAALIPLAEDRQARKAMLELGVLGPLINMLSMTGTDTEDSGAPQSPQRRGSISRGAMGSRLAGRRRSSVGSVGSVAGPDPTAQMLNSQLFAASVVLTMLEDDDCEGAIIHKFVALRGLDATLAACPPCANLEVLSLLLRIVLVVVATAPRDMHAEVLSRAAAVPLMLYLCARHLIALATAAARKAGSPTRQQRPARAGIRGGPAVAGTLGATSTMTSRRGSAGGPAVVVGAAGVMPIPVVHDMVAAASATSGALPHDRFRIISIAMQILTCITGARGCGEACRTFIACGGLAFCNRILRPDHAGPLSDVVRRGGHALAGSAAEPPMQSLAAALVTNVLTELPVDAPEAVLSQFGGVGMLDAIDRIHSGDAEVHRLAQRVRALDTIAAGV